MAIVRGSWTELLKPISEIFSNRTGINEVQMGGFTRMSMINSGEYFKRIQEQLHNQEQQMKVDAIKMQQNAYAMLGNQLNAYGVIQGLLGNYQPNPFQQAQEPIYPGKIIHKELEYHYHTLDKLKQLAAFYGFDYDWDTGGFKSKYGEFVSRMDIEGHSWEEVKNKFKSTRCPNIAWLDKRVDEMRIKLC